MKKKCDSCKGKGFLLANNDVYGLRIERCDTCEEFASDEAAVEEAYRLATLALLMADSLK